MTADVSPALPEEAVAARRPRWWPEVLVIVWLCWVYDAIANLAPLRQAVADAHARTILHAEQVLHIDPEAAMNHWLAAHHTLGLWVGNYYDNAHFVVTLGVVGLLWWRRPDLYRSLRTNLVVINLIGLAVFWLYPLAPPRLLDPSRYSDVVATSHAVGSWHTGALATAANQLAAMPSLHMAWAVWSALALWRVLGRRRWALAVWCYPAATGVAVLATGNHFVLDVVAGVATAVAAMVVADRWEAWWTASLARLAVLWSGSGVDQLEPVAETVVDVAAAHPRSLGGPADLDARRLEPVQQRVEGGDD